MAKRIAVIEKEKCNPEGCGGYLCIKVCPVNRTGSDCIVKGEDNKPLIAANLCTGCGICPNKCPFGAIHIINLPEELDKDPVHQYGDNGFHLFNLPTPQFGKVVGLLGRNGIGKSTAVKILAGLLKPNFGKFDKESDWDDLVEYFKGTEAQLYFEHVRDGKITISYKPQHVDLLPKTTKGNVKSLLEKVDEQGKMDEVVEALDLKHILERELDVLSGGELQRVAIAATAMKKANLYVFDEPTSFLDIKQRLKVSTFIRNLADEDTAVLVVEHDLIILDAMTDLIHVLYGKEQAYGVVSHPYSTRIGMNAYLEGFLKDENMRFRENKITFERRQEMKTSQPEVLTSWKDISHKQGDFSLEAVEGLVHKKEVVGVLGENGIGKTTFVKILSGVLETKAGEVEEVKVSYKPQHFEGEKEEAVMSYVKAALKHEALLMKPLGITPLLEKTLGQLSGGELQRVMIAKTLAEDADLYLLDEPSAYLDVEQRISISKIIRDFMEVKGKAAIIVDHDLLFLDYMSDTLLVFEGTPALNGKALGPYGMQEGMNEFLKDLNMTFRRDPESHRPRSNKENSQMDLKQKKEKVLYYI